MGLFDIFKKNKSTASFDALYKRIEEAKRSWELDTDTENEILSWSDQQKTALMLNIIRTYPQLKDGKVGWDYSSWNPRRTTFSILLAFLAKRRIDYGKDVIELLNSVLHSLMDIVKNRNGYNQHHYFLFRQVINNILRFHQLDQPDEIAILSKIKTELEALNQRFQVPELTKQIQRMEEVLFKALSGDGKAIQPAYFVGKDEFKDFANGIIDQQKDKDKNSWYLLVALAHKASGSRPAKKYLNDAKAIIAELGADKFKKVTHEWFDYLIRLKETTTTHVNVYSGQEYRHDTYDFLDTINSDAIKGFVWMSSWHHDSKTIQTIGKLAERCFKKIPGKGPAAEAVGNACLYTLFASKGLDGIAQLSKLKLKIKQNSTLKIIEKYIGEAAVKLEVTAEEIEDIAVDDYKLADFKRTQTFDDFTGILEMTGIGKSTLRWYKSDGTEQKTVPQWVRDKHPDRLKKFKDIQKQIDQTTSVQKERFDRMLRTDRRIPMAYFKEKYIGHGLLSFIINKVIFVFTNANESRLAIYLDKQWVDIALNHVNIDNYTEVSLWHPVNSSAAEVKEWRQFLMDKQIQQPFKQVFREIYIVTDAELNTRTYSNRMASHILKQHQYVTLAKGRNWNAKLLGSWDGGDQDTAELNMPHFNLRVEYWVNSLDSDDQFNESGIWNYVTTDQVRFINAETNETVQLIDVPPVAFSEAMRDVDLFVGVASVGNDPTWSDSGGLPAYRNYWQSYSFGDLSEIAKNRKEILVGLIPRLKIAPVTSVIDKFVVVKGKIRTYKIHIGSTNILMEPNDQYLCIVQDRSKKDNTGNLFVPFEGDTGLSVIISKAMLLAADDQITDPSITSQINR